MQHDEDGRFRLRLERRNDKVKTCPTTEEEDCGQLRCVDHTLSNSSGLGRLTDSSSVREPEQRALVHDMVHVLKVANLSEEGL